MFNKKPVEQVIQHEKVKRAKNAKPIHATYQKLEAFRAEWESNGGTRGTLRQARRAQGTLFPVN